MSSVSITNYAIACKAPTCCTQASAPGIHVAKCVQYMGFIMSSLSITNYAIACKAPTCCTQASAPGAYNPMLHVYNPMLHTSAPGVYNPVLHASICSWRLQS